MLTSRMRVRLIALVGAAMLPGELAAQITYYDAGYFMLATRDDPDVGPVSVEDNFRSNLFAPFFTNNINGNSIASFRSDPQPDGSLQFFGSAGALGQGEAGDRYVKGEARVTLDSTTGSAVSESYASWNAFAVPGGNAQADLSLYV
jgi:hypothetical protein